MGDLVPRGGPATHDYLADFFQFLRQRMGYVGDTFRAPAELQEIFEAMTVARFPRALWQALLNVSLRVVAAARTNGIGQSFRIVLTQVVIGLWFWYTEWWLLRGVLALLSWLSPTIITDIIMVLYRFVGSGVEKLWQFVRAKIVRHSGITVYSYRVLDNSPS